MTAKRYLALSISGFGVILLLSILVRLFTVYVLDQTQTSVTLSILLNQQANRTTAMRQAAANFAASPSAANKSALNTDFMAWNTGDMVVANEVTQFPLALNIEYATRIPAVDDITKYVQFMLVAGKNESLTDYYVQMVVAVGEYNTIINRLSAEQLLDNKNAISVTIWTNIAFGVVIVIVFGLELIYAILPAYYMLRDTLQKLPQGTEV